MLVRSQYKGRIMKHSIWLILTTLMASQALAVSESELRNGDILLQPLNCYLCNVIEEQEGSIYSHSGVVVRRHDGRVFVFESIGGESLVPLSVFVARTQKGQQVRVVRPIEFEQDVPSFKRLTSVFYRYFSPVVFDKQMRWENRDENGREPLYCSEFVAKFLANFLRAPYATKPMRFDVRPSFWFDFFGGDVPNGEPGIAPSDFLKSPLSRDLGDLEILRR
jgi:hypothetical protein